MKKSLLFAAGFTFLFSACIVTGPRRGTSRQGVHSHNCHPSEYWDGHKCKHKGKGKAKGHKKGHGHDKHKRH